MNRDKYSVKDVVLLLTAEAVETQRVRLIKRGIPDKKIIGVRKPAILRLAKKIGTDQLLANALWQTDYHEARLTAILIADPANITFSVLVFWIDGLWSWGITDHFARHLLASLPDDVRKKVLSYCLKSGALYSSRLAFAGIACIVQRTSEFSDGVIDSYYECIRWSATDERRHVRKAVVWALVEIAKSSNANRETASLLAEELANGCPSEKWLSRNAMREIELLVSVPERRRLISMKSKTGKKQPL